MEKSNYQEIIESIENTNNLYEKNVDSLSKNEIKSIENKSNLGRKNNQTQIVGGLAFLAIGFASSIVLPFIYFAIRGVAYRLAQIQIIEIEAIKGLEAKLNFYQSNLESLIQKTQLVSYYVYILLVFAIIIFLGLVYMINKTQKAENYEG